MTLHFYSYHFEAGFEVSLSLSSSSFYMGAFVDLANIERALNKQGSNKLISNFYLSKILAMY